MADLPVELKPHMITGLEDAFSTTVIVFENEEEQRFANDHVGKTFYELSWAGISLTLMEQLRAFFKVQLGAFREWTINDSRIGITDVIVRFNEDSLRITPVKFKFFNVKVKVKTC